jgi:hypothetical protein
LRYALANDVRARVFPFTLNSVSKCGKSVAI